MAASDIGKVSGVRLGFLAQPGDVGGVVRFDLRERGAVQPFVFFENPPRPVRPMLTGLAPRKLITPFSAPRPTPSSFRKPEWFFRIRPGTGLVRWYRCSAFSAAAASKRRAFARSPAMVFASGAAPPHSKKINRQQDEHQSGDDPRARGRHDHFHLQAIHHQHCDAGQENKARQPNGDKPENQRQWKFLELFQIAAGPSPATSSVAP